MKNQISYWQATKSPFYSFVFTLPLFGIYEVLTLFLSRSQFMEIRNGADVLIRQFIAMFDIWGMYALSIAFIIGFIGAFLWQKSQLKQTSVKSNYLLWMLMEGTLWGFLLYVVLIVFPIPLMLPTGKQIIQQIVLSIGAGLYEEFLFRVVLINLMSLLLKIIFQWKKSWCLVISVIISAFLFSGFHFYSTFGEAFDMGKFLYRAIAGVMLGTLYVIRGFGITAYSHMVYDFLVVFQFTVNNV
ncbi:MAG: CPBP family intramembrane metalloprotease [Candidatus Marinimicrobia bacterium]|nr:CPBP family intramembrane metalloprotease [Candidatus Neomarinimicrobiota bacterium]MBL7047196.1 CPBP family intramembrane metalloprotease [Candidatus Neomarinimicrobiota bacterium]